MLTLFYTPQSRASRVYQLLDELDALDKVHIEPVSIPRRDGTGSRDPKNPHPEGKVPTLVHDGEMIWESPAIFLYLTDLFPTAGLGPLVGQTGRGTYLSWLAWYGDVVEPVLHFRMIDVDHPGLAATFRDFDAMTARLAVALKDQPFLLGEHYSAADLLVSSAFTWLPELAPEDPAVSQWVERCKNWPSAKRAADYDASFVTG